MNNALCCTADPNAESSDNLNTRIPSRASVAPSLAQTARHGKPRDSGFVWHRSNTPSPGEDQDQTFLPRSSSANPSLVVRSEKKSSPRKLASRIKQHLSRESLQTRRHLAEKSSQKVLKASQKKTSNNRTSPPAAKVDLLAPQTSAYSREAFDEDAQLLTDTSLEDVVDQVPTIRTHEDASNNRALDPFASQSYSSDNPEHAAPRLPSLKNHDPFLNWRNSGNELSLSAFWDSPASRKAETFTALHAVPAVSSQEHHCDTKGTDFASNSCSSNEDLNTPHIAPRCSIDSNSRHAVEDIFEIDITNSKCEDKQVEIPAGGVNDVTSSQVHLYDMRISQRLRSMSSLSSESSTQPLSIDDQLRENTMDKAAIIELKHEEVDTGTRSSAAPSSNLTREDTESTSLDRYSSLTARNLDSGMDHGISNQENAAKENKNSMPHDTGGSPMTAKNETGSAAPMKVGKKVKNTASAFGRLLNSNVLPDKVKKTLGESDARKTVLVYDGPSEHSPASKSEFDTNRPSAKDSVRGNYDETAFVWEKALNAHQEEYERRKSKSSPQRAGSITSRRKSRSPNFRRDQQSVAEPPKSRPRSSSINFRPIETGHSFDRLVVPGRSSISQSESHLALSDHNDEDQDLDLNTRRRSASQPNLKDRADVKNTAIHEKPAWNIPAITITDTQILPEDQSAAPAQTRSASSEFEAWSRFPSHTRKERSESAGASDLVVARDFEPKQSSSGRATVANLHPLTSPPLESPKGHAKAMKKASRRFFRKDWAARIKPFTTGFRKAESGHRSSIAVSGELEYPELELLPVKEPKSPIKEDIVKSVQASKGRSVPSMRFSEGLASGFDKEDKSRHSLLGSSSHYASDEFGTPSSAAQRSEEPADPQRATTDANHYIDLIRPRHPQRRSTEEVSPLDGEVGYQSNASDNEDATFHSLKTASSSALASPGFRIRGSSAISLPSIQAERGRTRERQLRPAGNSFPSMPYKSLRAQSVDPVHRRSTQDLCRFLERGEEEALKNLRTASELWKD